MRLAQIFILCSTLVAISLGLFAYKAIVLKYPVVPNQEAQSWLLEAKIRFTPEYKAPVRVQFYKPLATDHLALVEENIIAPDYGIIERTSKKTGNRIAVLSRRETRGQQVLFYQSVFYELKSTDQNDNDIEPVVDGSYAAARKNPANAAQQTPVDAAIAALIQEAKEKSADNASFALEIARLLNAENDDRVAVLQSGLQKVDTVTEQAAVLINAADIPARVVNGIELKEHKRNVPLIQWLEVSEKGAWQSVDVENNKIGVGPNYLPWWYGTQSLISASGTHGATVEISAKYNREDAITQARWQSQKTAQWLANFSLFDLPIDTQIMFSIVLMIPLGGLVIVLLRQLVGVPTFGTFMPVLIALSFRETGLVWGIALFSIIVVIGLYLRAYFDRLRLLVVPRLASVLTIVVMLIAVLTVIAFKLGINAGLSITLFPMIILTMTIERMALMTEEFGAREARKTAYGSFFAAGLAYFAMHNVWAEHLAFVFPELLLIVLACTILLGRYNGYKLSEYFRFKKLARAIEESRAAEEAK